MSDTVAIHHSRLADWLVIRRMCKGNWREKSDEVREKVLRSIEHLPRFPDILAALLTSSKSFLSYYDCVKILNFMRDKEAETKDKSCTKIIAEWKGFLKQFEADHCFLGDSVNLLHQVAAYEISSLKKEIVRCNDTIKHLAKSVTDAQKKLEAATSEISRCSKLFGVKGDVDDDDVASLISKLRIDTNVDIATKFAKLKPAFEYYVQFIINFDQPFVDQQELKLFALIFENGCPILPDDSEFVTKGNNESAFRSMFKSHCLKEKVNELLVKEGKSELQFDDDYRENVFELQCTREQIILLVLTMNTFFQRRISEMLVSNFIEGSIPRNLKVTDKDLNDYVKCTKEVLEVLTTGYYNDVSGYHDSAKKLEHFLQGLRQKKSAVDRYKDHMKTLQDEEANAKNNLERLEEKLAITLKRANKLKNKITKDIYNLTDGISVEIIGLGELSQGQKYNKKIIDSYDSDDEEEDSDSQSDY